MRENKKPINDASEKQVRRQLSFKSSAADQTFAILEAGDGSYVQMKGGGVGCVLEWRNIEQRHFRAWVDPPKVPWKVPGLLGGVLVRPEDHLFIDDIIEVFCAFLNGQPFPSEIRWRDITSELVNQALGDTR